MGYYVGRGHKDGKCGPQEERDRPRNIVEATFFAICDQKIADLTTKLNDLKNELGDTI